MSKPITIKARNLTITLSIDRGHFSVTADQYQDGRLVGCGAMHSEILAARPDLADIVALNLSDAQTGAPLHALGNGWYWLAGALGGLHQEFHGGQLADARRTAGRKPMFR